MKHLALISSLLFISACSTPSAGLVEPGLPVVDAPEAIGGQLTYQLASGNYHCEFGHTLDVQRDAQSQNRINIGWKGVRYDLDRDHSFSGLPRYEDRQNGLVWIELPWKGVLLDGKTHKPLANECKTT